MTWKVVQTNSFPVARTPSKLSQSTHCRAQFPRWRIARVSSCSISSRYVEMAGREDLIFVILLAQDNLVADNPEVDDDMDVCHYRSSETS
jgi:hypothetical protein